MSERYGFIFLKSRKTGGSSIEAILAPSALPNGIVSKCPEAERDVRLMMDAPLALNSGIPLHRANVSDWRRAFRRREWPQRFLEHETAGDLISKLGEEKWKSMHKVSVVRNPFARVVSDFYWRTRKQNVTERSPSEVGEEFLRWVKANRSRHGGNWLNFYQIEGSLCLDSYLRFESLKQDFEHFLMAVGAPTKLAEALSIVHVKGGLRMGVPTAKELYEMKPGAYDIVARECAPEMDAFGYHGLSEYSPS